MKGCFEITHHFTLSPLHHFTISLTCFMNWLIAHRGFLNYLRLEKSLSANSLEAYSADVSKLQRFAESTLGGKSPDQILREPMHASIKDPIPARVNESDSPHIPIKDSMASVSASALSSTVEDYSEAFFYEFIIKGYSLI